MISDKLVLSIVIYYEEGEISRMRANYKDVIESDQSELRVRFMRPTLPDAVCEYDRCFPGLVGCSNIYLLRTRHVRIVSYDATCLCISHEKVLLVATG